MSFRRVVFVSLPLVAVACGASALPPAQLSDSQAAIRAAEAVGADHYPQGALYMKRARDNMASADRFADDRDDEKAKWALVQAEADAEVALAVAQAEQARAQALQAQRAVTQLRESAD